MNILRRSWTNECESFAELYWKGKTEMVEEKYLPVSFCSPKIPRLLTLNWTDAYAVTGRRLTAWVMPWPVQVVFRMCIVVWNTRWQDTQLMSMSDGASVANTSPRDSSVPRITPVYGVRFRMQDGRSGISFVSSASLYFKGGIQRNSLTGD